MQCEEVRRFASLYLDGEFDELEGARFEEHLEQCSECRALLQSQRVFQQALASRLNPPRTPRATRERIAEAMRLEMNAPSRIRLWRVPLAAAATVLLAVGLFSVLTSIHPDEASEEVNVLVEESVAVHEAALPPEIEGDSKRIEGFLADKAKLDLRPPIPESASTRLLGVRLTRVGKSRAVLYNYLHNNRPVSVVQVPRKQNRPNQQGRLTPAATRVLYDGARRGYNFTLFEDPESTNTVISDIPSRELRKLIPASL